MFVGDIANKPNGVIYRYYKCAGAKRHECDRKAIRKDWIEDKAIEKGVVTRSTKSRLEELEAEEEKITLNIKLEEAKRPKITKEFIIFTLNKFRNLDLRFEKNKERLIDGLVKAIFVYDDYIKLILTFDDKPINIPTSDEIENMANSSDIQSNVSPIKKESGFTTLFFYSKALPNRTRLHSHSECDMMCAGQTLSKINVGAHLGSDSRMGHQ